MKMFQGHMKESACMFGLAAQIAWQVYQLVRLHYSIDPAWTSGW